MTVVKKDESQSESSEEIVNPSEVSAKNGGKIDSDKLVDESLIDPVQRIDESMIDRIQKLTSREAHDFLRRCIFSDHRDFDAILDAYERGGETFYVYTGKELSSEALRLEELVRFMFAKYLQDAFNVPVVIQLTDDDELRKKFTVEERQRLARENAKDTIACGFDITKTFIFYVRDYFEGAYYQNMVKFMNCVPLKEAEQVLGLKSEDHVPNHSLEGAGAPADGQKPTDGYYIGKLSVLPVQAVPSFPSTFPHLFPGNDNLRCLIPCAIDQDSCFRKARDVAPQLGYSKPALVESSVFPPLQEKNGKDPNSAIYVTDAPEVIKKKINSAISGGRQFKEDQEKLGADLEIDVPFKYLNFFLEDDSELEHIKKEYGPGEMQIGAQKMQTGAVKKRAAEVLMEMVERYCRARVAVTEEMVDAFMAVRPLLTMFGSDFKSSRHKFAAASPQPTDHQKLHRSFSPGRKVEDKKDEGEAEASEQVVNPWEVSAKNGRKIDYDKLIKEFGCQRLDESIIDRVQRLTSRQPHVFLRRGVFFAHRDFNEILDSHEIGEKFYLYTGRGPSSEALHLGHLIPFMFTKYLQEAFKVPLVIQLTDDEKCMWKNITVEESQRLARENAKDIIACGFDITKTFIFSDFDYVGGAFYDNMMKVADCVTINKIMGIFGFTGEDHMGKVCFPPVQAVPSFPSSFPHMFPGKDKLRCLIPCAIDQDPYFRMTRDVAERLGSSKPALIEASFLPALQGDNGKMSASDPNSAIYVTDTADDIKNKINRVFSGAKDEEELKRIVGAFLEYLHFFLEDDGELERIKKEYGAGIMLAEAVKDRLIEVLTEIVERHRRARAAVTDEMVDAFMALRLLLLSMFK